MNIEAVDAVAYSDRWAPRRGWHDDNRAFDRTPAYLPALQQVRSEFAAFIDVLRQFNLLGGRCLQLGMGECDASHAAWSAIFGFVMTIDFRVIAYQKVTTVGGNTRDPDVIDLVRKSAPFDLLFIDAGHKIDDIASDHANYGPLVRKGGIIAFHDACKRPGYEEEIDVWRYLEKIGCDNLIGDEVGIAWIEPYR